MIRLYRKMAQDAFQVLVWAKDHGYRLKKMRDDNIANWYHRGPQDSNSEENIRVAMKAAVENCSSGDTTDDIIKELSKSLNTDSQRWKTDSDLIESIARTLQLPFSRNVLSAKVLDALTQAVLIPEEIGRLQALLKDREMVCAECRVKLESGESLTLHADKNGRILYCAKCYPIGAIRCGCGKHLAQVPDKISRALKKGVAKCDSCRVGSIGDGNGVNGADVEIGRELGRWPVNRAADPAGVGRAAPLHGIPARQMVVPQAAVRHYNDLLREEIPLPPPARGEAERRFGVQADIFRAARAQQNAEAIIEERNGQNRIFFQDAIGEAPEILPLPNDPFVDYGDEG